MHVVSLAVMEELSNGKSPSAWVFAGSWDIAGGLAALLGRWSVEDWTLGLSVWGVALWKSLWELEGHIKVGHDDAHKKTTPPPSSFERRLEPPSGPFALP